MILISSEKAGMKFFNSATSTGKNLHPTSLTPEVLYRTQHIFGRYAGFVTVGSLTRGESANNTHKNLFSSSPKNPIQHHVGRVWVDRGGPEEHPKIIGLSKNLVLIKLRVRPNREFRQFTNVL